MKTLLNAECGARSAERRTTHHAPRTTRRTSNTQHPTSRIQYPVSSIQHPASSIQNPTSSIQHHPAPCALRPALRAFTMIEIAISLAVIGFALVAIIGILPTGLDVQKQNKEETIINQDASVFIEAIRTGAQGMDDLTNYVYSITKYSTVYNPPNPPSAPRVEVYSNFSLPYGINNGYRIIGLLSTPKYTYDDPGNPPPAYTSNYVVALVRSMSGSAFDKYPQDNGILQDAAFKYRMIAEVVPYWNTDPSWVNPDPANPFYQGVTYTNLVRHREVNLSDVRLIFRWPVLPNGNIGNSRLVFRTQVSGSITNEPTNFLKPPFAYFFESRNYVKAAP